MLSISIHEDDIDFLHNILCSCYALYVHTHVSGKVKLQLCYVVYAYNT